VYVFTRSGTTWSQEAYVKASNTEADDLFGFSLSLSGDTLVAGAVSEDSDADGIGGNQADNAAFEAGAAYVFTRSGTTWTQEAYLKASNSDSSDNFAYSLSLEGDLLVVGARGEASTATGINGNQASNGAPNAGAVYAFSRAGATWTQGIFVKSSNTQGADEFGRSLALSAGTFVAGAKEEDSSAIGIDGNQADELAEGAGAVYVFR
jgi:hypothetical protein